MRTWILGHGIAPRAQHLERIQEGKGASSALKSIHGSVSGDIAGVHLEASRLNSPDFVNPMDGRTYQTALQDLNLFDDAVTFGKKQSTDAHFDEKVSAGGVDLHLKK
jgi:hypothetical protein